MCETRYPRLVCDEDGQKRVPNQNGQVMDLRLVCDGRTGRLCALSGRAKSATPLIPSFKRCNDDRVQSQR